MRHIITICVVSLISCLKSTDLAAAAFVVVFSVDKFYFVRTKWCRRCALAHFACRMISLVGPFIGARANTTDYKQHRARVRPHSSKALSLSVCRAQRINTIRFECDFVCRLSTSDNKRVWLCVLLWHGLPSIPFQQHHWCNTLKFVVVVC